MLTCVITVCGDGELTLRPVVDLYRGLHHGVQFTAVPVVEFPDVIRGGQHSISSIG